MHSREKSQFEPMRSGLWLVIDLIDDLLERGYDAETSYELVSLRGATIDLLYRWRKLEQEHVAQEKRLRNREMRPKGPRLPAA